MTNYITNDQEMINYMKDRLTDSINLIYEVDTVVKEGIPFPFFQNEVADVIMQNEKLTKEQAWGRLYNKFAAKEPLKLITDCINKTEINRPDIIISFWYYPEYSLLISSINEIKYTPGHAKGWLYLAEINDIGETVIKATTYWTN